MRKIGVVSVSRSDYGIYFPILKAILQEPDLELCLIVTGSHLVSRFGNTIAAIEADGFSIAERVEILMASDSPEGIAKSMGLGIIGLADAYSRQNPDIILVLGDRFEMHSAALAALPFKIPVAHIHGGEETLGAFDNSLRHSITKLSHIHFASTQEYAKRLIQLGEEPWRVIVSGAPGLDNLRMISLLSASELKGKYQVNPALFPPLLVTFHPTTLEYEHTEWQTKELMIALSESGLPVIFTMPNADTNGSSIRNLIIEYVSKHTNSQSFDNLGTQAYLSLMALSRAVVGNSSSGIIEAASLHVPVVNIGTRQQGRLHARNVVDTDYNHEAILKAIDQVISPKFHKSLQDLKNPYGDGHSTERIIEKLRSVAINDQLLFKPFFDVKFELELRR